MEELVKLYTSRVKNSDRVADIEGLAAVNGLLAVLL
jgi:hypothetical protein